MLNFSDRDVRAVVEVDEGSTFLVDASTWPVVVPQSQLDRIDPRFKPGQRKLELPVNRLPNRFRKLLTQASDHQSHGNIPFNWDARSQGMTPCRTRIRAGNHSTIHS